MNQKTFEKIFVSAAGLQLLKKSDGFKKDLSPSSRRKQSERLKRLQEQELRTGGHVSTQLTSSSTGSPLTHTSKLTRGGRK